MSTKELTTPNVQCTVHTVCTVYTSTCWPLFISKLNISLLFILVLYCHPKNINYYIFFSFFVILLLLIIASTNCGIDEVKCLFSKNWPLGRFFHRVVMSVYGWSPFHVIFLRGLSLALRSHDQIPDFTMASVPAVLHDGISTLRMKI